MKVKENYSKYINNVKYSTLKEFISKEVVNIKKYIKDNISKVDDKIVKIKLSEPKLLEKLNSGGVVKDSQVVSLMRWYQLVKEIKDVVSSKLKEIIRELIKQELEILLLRLDGGEGLSQELHTFTKKGDEKKKKKKMVKVSGGYELQKIDIIHIKTILIELLK